MAALSALPAPVQAGASSPALRAPRAEGQGPLLPPACSEGSVKDDGTVETGWGWVPSVIEGNYVQVYDSSEFPSSRMEKVCLCWLRTQSDDSIDFEVVFFRDLEGAPELLPFAAVPATATGVPQGIVGAFYEVDVSGVEIPPGRFYVGARWDASRDQFFFVCADTNDTTPFTNLFFIDDRAEEWDNAADTNDPIFSVHRAVLVRPVADEAAVVEIPAQTPLGLVALALLLAVAGGLTLVRIRAGRA